MMDGVNVDVSVAGSTRGLSWMDTALKIYRSMLNCSMYGNVNAQPRTCSKCDEPLPSAHTGVIQEEVALLLFCTMLYSGFS